MIMKNKVKIGIILFFLLICYYFLNQKLDIGIPCIFHELTGLYCPGCGITRLLFSLFELNFYQAFRSNPLVFILLILSIFYLLIKVILKIFNISITIPNYIYYILLVIIILFGILRNIPGFEILKPICIIM